MVIFRQEVRSMRALFGAAIVFASLCVAGGPATAGVPTDQLKASVDEIIRILEDPSLKGETATEKRRATLRQAASQVFDFQEASRRALGRHWQSMSEPQRQEFVALFTDLLERSYVGRIEQYSGEKFSFLGDSADPTGGQATVRTKFTTSKGQDIPVDYRMLQRGDRWLVYDVSVEGLSLVANYRGQFNRIVESGSVQDLLNRLRAKSDEFGAPAAGQPRRTPRS
jgi:phospholipid transport system substrate-binding protein